MVLETVNRIEQNTIAPRPQDDTQATPAPKIRKKDCRILWSQPAEKVHNQIRALTPFPGASTTWRSQRLKIYGGTIVDTASSDSTEPGTIYSIEEDMIIVTCQPGLYGITRLQLEGKRRMEVADFLHGRDLHEGEKFG